MPGHAITCLNMLLDASACLNKSCLLLARSQSEETLYKITNHVNQCTNITEDLRGKIKDVIRNKKIINVIYR